MGLENVNETKATTAINAAVIVIGSYHMAASVAFGAAVGASLFILSQNQHSPLTKAWLFAVSFFSGIFGGETAAGIFNWVLSIIRPDAQPLKFNEFLGAALFSALVVVIVNRLIDFVGTAKQTTQPNQKKGESE